ncbi:MAG: c-type cytochrome [Ignavibacteria bacterium]
MKTTLLLFLFVTAILVASAIRQKNYEQKRTASIILSIADGAKIYTTNCLTCHMADGGGVPRMNPPLVKTSLVLGSKEKLIDIILNGMSRQEIDGETYSNIMPSFAFLKDNEIADVLTYVRKSFGNNAGPVSESEVKKIRAKLASGEKAGSK